MGVVLTLLSSCSLIHTNIQEIHESQCFNSKAVCQTLVTSLLVFTTDMGKLNIAHHKSYHPYRRDNIERVRKDEEEARQKEEHEDGRMMLAVSFYDSSYPT